MILIQVSTYHNHAHESSHNKSNIDSKVREPNKPPIACARFKLSSSLSAGNTTSWILAADTDAGQETPRRQRGEQAISAATGI